MTSLTFIASAASEASKTVNSVRDSASNDASLGWIFIIIFVLAIVVILIVLGLSHPKLLGKLVKDNDASSPQASNYALSGGACGNRDDTLASDEQMQLINDGFRELGIFYNPTHRPSKKEANETLATINQQLALKRQR